MIRSGSAISRVLMAGVLIAAGSPCWAQAKAAPKKPTSEEKTFTTKDGVALHGTYFPSAAGKNAPVVILLHGTKGNRLVWQTGMGNFPGFAQALQANDFAVVTLDLRLHGENITGGQGAPAANKKAEPIKLSKGHYEAMVVYDLEAVKKFLLEEHESQQLNIGKLAIVGAEFSTAVAMAYFERDWAKEPWDDNPVPEKRTPKGQDVKALVLLSPDSSVPGLVTNTVAQKIRALNTARIPISVMIAVGDKDDKDKGAANKLHELISPKKDEFVTFESYPTKFRGTDMLNKGLKLEAQMYKFLDEKVKKLEIEWRTRKSPLQD